jgi:hypothetical protein
MRADYQRPYDMGPSDDWPMHAGTASDSDDRRRQHSAPTGYEPLSCGLQSSPGSPAGCKWVAFRCAASQPRSHRRQEMSIGKIFDEMQGQSGPEMATAVSVESADSSAPGRGCGLPKGHELLESGTVAGNIVLLHRN